MKKHIEDFKLEAVRIVPIASTCLRNHRLQGGKSPRASYCQSANQ